MNGIEMYREWLTELPSELNVVIDIGSHHGEFIEVFDDKKINEFYYFEPDCENFTICQKLMNNFDFTKGYNYGIFYGVKESPVHGIGDNNIAGYMVSEIESKYKEEIFGNRIITYENKIFRLDTLENFIGVPADLVKIDVEASEYNIIENSKILKTATNIFVEWHNKPKEYIENFIKINLPMYYVHKWCDLHTFLKLK